MNSKKIIRVVVLIGMLILISNFTQSLLNTKGIYIPPDDDLPRTVTYSGYVKNTDGVKLSGATVRFYSGSSLKRTTTTSSTGYYSIATIQYSTPILKVSKSDYITQTKSVSINGGSYNFYLEQDIPVYPTYTGYIRNTDGVAIENAFVQLFSGGVQVSTDYSDSYGHYCVGNDYVISPILRAEKTGCIAQTKSVSTNGGSYSFNLVEPSTPIYTGYIRDNDGNELANVRVTLYVTVDGGGVKVCTDYSDSYGYYCVENDVAYLPYLDVGKTGYAPQLKYVSSSGGTYDINLGIKIAVFFWASSCSTSTYIDIYKGYLEDEGYTKFFILKIVRM